MRKGPALCLATTVIAACASDPETLSWLTFDADGPSDDASESLAVRVCNQEGAIVLDRRYESPSWPFRIELTPRDGQNDRRYWALGELLSATVEPIARKRVHSGYEPGEQLEHVIRFEQACLFELTCGVTESCENGTCIDARRAPVRVEGDAPIPPFGCRAVSLGDTVCSSPPPGTVLCEGFETADPLETWNVYTSSGELSVTSSIAARGTRSLLAVTTDSPSNEARARALFTGGEGATELYARAQIFVRSGTPFGHAELLRILRNNADFGFGVQVIGPIEAPAGELRIIPRDGTSPTANTGIAFPFDEWFCLTLSVGIGEPGSITVDRGSAGSFTLEGIDTLPAGGAPFDAVMLGVVYATDAGLEVAIDELVVSTEPLGCEG